MKALFEDKVNFHTLTFGMNDKNEICINSSNGKGDYTLIDLNLQEAYELERFISGLIRKMEDAERSKLPIWKRIF